MANNLTGAAGYFDTITIEGSIVGTINCGATGGLPDGGIPVDGSSIFVLSRVDRDFDNPAAPGPNQFQLTSEAGEEHFYGPPPSPDDGFAVIWIPIQDFLHFSCADANYSPDIDPGQSFATATFNIQRFNRRAVIVTSEPNVQITSEPKVQIVKGLWAWGTEFEFTTGCIGPHPTDSASCYPSILLGMYPTDVDFDDQDFGEKVHSLLGLKGTYSNEERQTFPAGPVDPEVALGDWTISWTTTFE